MEGREGEGEKSRERRWREGGGRGTAAIGHERWRIEMERGRKGGRGRGTAAIDYRYAFVVRVTVLPHSRRYYHTPVSLSLCVDW